MSQSPQERPVGIKHDEGKLRYDLIPPWPLKQLADVYTRGAAKYGDRNWEVGIPWSRVYAALMRHVQAWWAGEDRDSEDKQYHMASVAWCAFALMQYSLDHEDLDDRPGIGMVHIKNRPQYLGPPGRCK